jgi:thiol reductant ABC exporter CydC subunit
VKPFLRLMAFLAPFKRRVLLSILLQLATIGANIGLMATSAYLIAAAALHPSTILLVWVPIVGVRFFGISRAVFRYAEQYVSHDLTFRILTNIRVWVFERVEFLSTAFLFRRKTGDVLTSLVSDVDTLQNVYLRAIIPPIVACLVATLVYFIINPFGSRLAFVFLSLYFCAGFVIPVVVHRWGSRVGEQMIETRGELYSHFAEQLQGAYETQLYPHGELLSELQRKQDALASLQSRMTRIHSVSSGGVVLFSNFTMWILLWMAIPSVTHHAIDGVYLPVIALTALASFEAVKPLPAAFQHWGQSLRAAKRLFDLADSPAPVKRAATGMPYPMKEFSLSVRNLTFRYTDEDAPALCDVDFDVPFGKHIAIVGENGAGKSTLVNLLLGLYGYEDGSIRLGNIELSEMNEEQIRQIFTLVSQHTYLFNATVLENLKMAKPNATQSEVEYAARVAQLHDVIVNLPQGYDTLIGEAGARLSGGERQRLALARAVLRPAPILVFDEPTNGLDSVTEQSFVRALRPVIAGRSTIYITHRLIGLEEMDEILVMQRGRMVERGTHYALLERGGLYRTMWELQREMLRSNPA